MKTRKEICELLNITNAMLIYRINEMEIVSCGKRRQLCLHNDFQIELIKENDKRNYKSFSEIYESKINDDLRRRKYKDRLLRNKKAREKYKKVTKRKKRVPYRYVNV